jgi:DNA-binding beta-propeller fold protein YncE
MDSVTVDDYVLKIDGKTATLTEFVHNEISGVSTSLDVNNKTVTVDVSERPVLIFSE